MTTPISSADIQQPLQPIAAVQQPVQQVAAVQSQRPALPPEFKPSYNAVQLNFSSPTLNAPPAMPPLPPTASKQWVA